MIIITKSGMRYATTEEAITKSTWPLQGVIIKKYIQFKELQDGNTILIKESSIDHIIIKNNGEEKV
jgi:hypothetical protein